MAQSSHSWSLMDVRGLSFHIYHRGSPWSRSVNDMLLNDHTYFSPRSYWRRSYSPLLHATSLCQPTEGFDTCNKYMGPFMRFPVTASRTPKLQKAASTVPIRPQTSTYSRGSTSHIIIIGITLASFSDSSRLMCVTTG